MLLGDVHPEARRLGLGRALLGWQEARAVERFITELPLSPLPRRIDVYGPEADAGRTALLREAGYQVLRWQVVAWAMAPRPWWLAMSTDAHARALRIVPSPG